MRQTNVRHYIYIPARIHIHIKRRLIEINISAYINVQYTESQMVPSGIFPDRTFFEVWAVLIMFVRVKASITCAFDGMGRGRY